MSGRDRIEAIAREALASVPEPFRAAAAGVVLRVEDWPDEAMLDELGIEDPLDLTGLYDGVPLTEKSPANPDPFADVIWLFAEPILDELAERDGETLERLVSHVVIHELAHHFGWSDDDIAAIDEWWL